MIGRYATALGWHETRPLTAYSLAESGQRGSIADRCARCGLHVQSTVARFGLQIRCGRPGRGLSRRPDPRSRAVPLAFPPHAQLLLSDNDFSGSRNRHRHHLSATLLDGLETAGSGCYDAVPVARAAGFRMLVMSRIRHAGGKAPWRQVASVVPRVESSDTQQLVLERLMAEAIAARRRG